MQMLKFFVYLKPFKDFFNLFNLTGFFIDADNAEFFFEANILNKIDGSLRIESDQLSPFVMSFHLRPLLKTVFM